MKEAIQIAIQANVPVLIWGEPGMGKTSFVQQLAGEYDAHLETIVASLRDPTDFGGLPIRTSDDDVYLAPPRWARRLNESAELNRPAWAFFDEITTAAPAVQAALLRVIHERTVGDLNMSPKVRMLAAANPPDQAAGGWDLAPPLANRFFHYEWNVSASEWSDNMVQGFPPHKQIRVTDSFITMIPQYRAIVASFVRSAAQNLIVVPKEDSAAGMAWPSPRTWDMASRLMAANDQAGGDEELRAVLIKGCVGEGAAMSFLGWLKELDLPNPEDLLADPDSYELPDRSDKVYTVVTSVVAAVAGKTTRARWIAAWKILHATAEQGSADVAAAAARTLATLMDLNTKGLKQEIAPLIMPFKDMMMEIGALQERTVRKIA